MSLVPMQFSQADAPAGKANRGHSFQLAPTPGTVYPPQSCKVSNRFPNRHRFDVADLTDYFKIHRICIKPPSDPKYNEMPNGTEFSRRPRSAVGCDELLGHQLEAQGEHITLLQRLSH